MTVTVIRLVLTSLCVVILSGCATTTKVEKIGTELNSRGNDCKVEFFRDSKPSKTYKVIGKIESHISRNIFLGGKVTLEGDVYKELSLKACNIGGEAVIIDDYMENSALEMTHIHVWATAIKYY
jgi:hypothetical protein